MAYFGDGLGYLFFLLLNEGMPAGKLEQLMLKATDSEGRRMHADSSLDHWLVRKADELAWRTRLPGLTRTDPVTLRRLGDLLAGLDWARVNELADPSVLMDGLRAGQSLEDLGQGANLQVSLWMREIETKLAAMKLQRRFREPPPPFQPSWALDGPPKKRSRKR